MKPPRLSRFGRETALPLLIEPSQIVAIKLVFFANPVKPGSEGTARALLDRPAMERNAPHG